MNQLEQFGEVRAFVFDIDGVLTNNRIYILEDGGLMRQLHLRDALAMQLAVRAGYPIAVIAGGRSEGIKEQLFALGINFVYLGTEDKLEPFSEFLTLHELTPAQALFMGDDLPDYTVMRRAGVAACPADAAYEIKRIASYISPLAGGAGCVRDVIEKVMRIQGRWPTENELVRRADSRSDQEDIV